MNKKLYLVNCNEENFLEETPEISAEYVDNDMITLIIDFDKPLKRTNRL